LDLQVLTETGKSLGYRFQYWQATAELIADRPVTGCGPGNFQYAYTRYKLPEASEEIGDPHNFLLEVWATAGTPALLALVAALAVWYWAVLRRREPKQAFPSAPSGDAAAFVMAGLFFGLVLSIPLSWVSSAPPGAPAVLISLPLSAVSMALLRPWIQAGCLPIGLPVVALTALLVNLLAAGGIGFPGVSGSMWLLMALGLSVAEGDSIRRLPRPAGMLLLCLALLAAVACYGTAYSPVMNATAWQRRAIREPIRAEQHLRKAANSDHFAAKPWKQLAELAFRRWLAGTEEFKRWEDDARNVVELTPNSATAWFHLGEQYRRAFERSGQPEHIQKAVSAYRHAVDLYPTLSHFRARLALALQASGDTDGFREQAEESLRLDATTPHADKKLTDELRDLLVRTISNGD
jgi:hypothetical protein